MDKNIIEKWKQQYNTVNFNTLQWLVMNTYDLLEFYDKNYIDEELDEAVSEDIVHYNALGMYYLPMRQESIDMRYLIGVCDNIIGKKTLIACISYIENYKLFSDQTVPLTYLCTCEVNKYFRNIGISKIMFDEFAKVIRSNQHFMATPQSENGELCRVHKNLYNSLINNGFKKSIILNTDTSSILTSEYHDLLCDESIKLKMK